MALSMKQAVYISNRSLCSISNKVKMKGTICCARQLSSDNKPRNERRVFSGIQPTGIPHIGNYFGAIKPWVEMQNRWGNVFLSVVDLHSITMPHNPKQLRKNIHEMFACLLACGIDPEKTVLFQQSAVMRHAELSWILGCLTTMPRLQHLPQWKQKSEKLKEVPLGLFTYPVLQAADILLYKATDVPVGDDQVIHVELARDLAKSFNKKYGETFPKPKPIVGAYDRIKSLQSPENKMSKSEENPRCRIELMDTPDTIQEKLRKAVTDFTSNITYEPTARPGVSNLINIHSAFTDLDPEEICEQSMHLDTLQYKMVVAEAIIEGTTAIRENFENLMQNEDYLGDIIQKGNDKAKSVAEKTYDEVTHKVGFC